MSETEEKYLVQLHQPDHKPTWIDVSEPVNLTEAQDRHSYYTKSYPGNNYRIITSDK